jgi:putative hydrolase of the HAD superfamily
MGIEAVTFDCWGTLLFERDRHATYARRVEALAVAVCGAAGAAELGRARLALDAAWRRHIAHWEAGMASGAPEIARWALAELAPERSGEAARLAERFVRIGAEAEVAALAGARDTLARLAAEGVGRALVCDTGFTPGRAVRTLLDRAGLLELLSVTVFSDEQGVPKPHPQVFAAALAGLGARASEAIHVGDLRRTDVSGGRGAGMGTIRIRAHYDDPIALPDADAVADSHAHLQEILDARAGACS